MTNKTFTHAAEAALRGLPGNLRGDQCWHLCGLDQFRPDASKGFLAQHLAGQFTFGFILYTPRFGWVHVPTSREALVEVLLVDPVGDSQSLAVFGGNFFAHVRYGSESLDRLQANR